MRVLIIGNDRKGSVVRLQTVLKSIVGRVDEAANAHAAVRTAQKRRYNAIVLVVPAQWESLITDVETIRLTGVSMLVFAEEDIPVSEQDLLSLGVVEVVPATAPDDELATRLRRFLHRNDEFYQPFDDASRSGNGRPGYMPMDDESTCWFCVEQGKASIEHRNLESAEKWLGLAITVDPGYQDAKRLRDAIARHE
jgi:DNA-binding response OmpR family regulator